MVNTNSSKLFIFYSNLKCEFNMIQAVIDMFCVVIIYRQTFASGETYNEQGQLKRVTNPEDGQEKDVIVTRGSYTIIDKDGSTVVVNYTADENGFHPEIGKY